MAYGTTIDMDLLANLKDDDIKIVDLRSDTLTKPTESMRKAMYEAQVGDDVYGEDPTVNKLEEKAAKLVGKEAAIFVSSGTMGNLIAIMNHCDERGSEAYCGSETHAVLHEQGGAAQIAGVSLWPIQNNDDGSFDLKILEKCMRGGGAHEAISKLVIVENTNNGKVVPMSWIKELKELAKKYKLKLHMDGARLWNASVASNVPATEIVSDFDSVTFCLSKGLGAPVGSMLCGDAAFVAKARRARKALGGGLRQCGILAAAGLVALEEILPVLKKDHRRAAAFAAAINDFSSKSFFVAPDSVQTNMVFLNLASNTVTAKDFLARLQNSNDQNGPAVIIKASAMANDLIRFVFYHEIDDHLLQAAICKISEVIKFFDSTV